MLRRKSFERDYLVRLLKITGGNVTQAAQLAKRNRTEFYKLLQRHGIEAAVFNRTPGKLDARPLDAFTRRDGEIVINTLPIYRNDADINAAYGERPTANDGRALLEAQAIRQNKLFLEAMQ